MRRMVHGREKEKWREKSRGQMDVNNIQRNRTCVDDAT